MTPNFSARPYPFERLRKLTRPQAEAESTVARWLGARPRRDRLAKLVAGPVRVEVVAPGAFDPFAARATVRVGGAAFEVRGSSRAVRAIAQRLLGGPPELAASRPLGLVEQSLWSLVVATALEDLGVAGEVWPELDDSLERARAEHAVGRDDSAAGGTRAERPAARTTDATVVELAVHLGDLALAVQIHAPRDLALRVPPQRPPPAWFDAVKLEVPIVVGRCALARGDLGRLAVRSVVTLERPRGVAELVFLGGAVGLRAEHGALEAQVATGYGVRDMSLPDEAHVELTVALGTTELSLRQLSELAVGQIIQLGRPLAGPFEVRAAGRVVGRGELVDVDGELAVRIVSLGD